MNKRRLFFYSLFLFVGLVGFLYLRNVIVSVSAATPTPTPIPKVRAVVIDQNSAPYQVNRVCKVSCSSNSSCVANECAPDDNRITFSKTVLGTIPAKQGVKIALKSKDGSKDLVFLGVTGVPDTKGTLLNPCPNVGGVCYVWNSNSWTSGVNVARFVVQQITATITVSPSVTVTTSPSPTVTKAPTPTINPDCLCGANDLCNPGCRQKKLKGITYPASVRCSGPANIYVTPPTAADKNFVCQAYKRRVGDANGDGIINDIDYDYYTQVVLGAKVAPRINPDFNADGEVGSLDRTIIIQRLTRTADEETD